MSASIVHGSKSSAMSMLLLLSLTFASIAGEVHVLEKNIVFEDEHPGRGRVPEHVRNKFMQNHGVKPGFDLTFRELVDNQIVMPDGEIIIIDDGFEPEPIFSPSARCFSSETLVPCPEPSVSTKFANGVRIQINRKGNGSKVMHKLTRDAGAIKKGYTN